MTNDLDDTPDFDAAGDAIPRGFRLRPPAPLQPEPQLLLTVAVSRLAEVGRLRMAAGNVYRLEFVSVEETGRYATVRLIHEGG
jgi:hypothetical protein